MYKKSVSVSVLKFQAVFFSIKALFSLRLNCKLMELTIINMKV